MIVFIDEMKFLENMRLLKCVERRRKYTYRIHTNDSAAWFTLSAALFYIPCAVWATIFFITNKNKNHDKKIIISIKN